MAVTLNGSTGILYVDGQVVGSNTNMTLVPSNLGVTTQNWIGRSQFTGDPYLNGLVDDFRFYSQALTPTQVQQVMNENNTSVPTVPILTAAPTKGASINLSWTQSYATSYTIQRATVSGGPYTTLATGVTGTSYTDSGLTLGTTYYYVVTAIKSGYQNLNSVEVSAKTSLFAANQDIGAPGLAGSTAYDGTQYVVKGPGADIWGSSDQFQYSYTSATGDAIMTARVDSQTNTNAWAKAGLMFRDSLNSNAAEVFMGITPSNGVTFQYRSGTGQGSALLVKIIALGQHFFRLLFIGWNHLDIA